MRVTIRRNHFLVLATTALAVLLPAVSARAGFISLNNFFRISVAPRVNDGTSNTLATLARTKDGSIMLMVRSFDRRTGFQQGSDFIFSDGSVRFTDVLVSVVFEPNDPMAGLQHVLVLDSERRVHFFPLGFRADGTPFLDGSVRIIGPLGPPDAGEATVLGEAPNPANPDEPFLGIGTMNGHVVVSTPRVITGLVAVRVSSGPIQDLGAIPQVGYFALGAVSNGTLFVITEDAEATMAGLQPRLMASLHDPRPIPLIDFGSPLLTRDSEPFINPLSDLIVTANGTTEIATLEIPPNPGFGDVMTVRFIDPLCTPVKQVVLNSLSWLPFDGAGVLYNAGFTLEDGIVGRIWTIAGASMDVAPETLNLGSGGRFVTVRIEAENERAAAIDLTTLTLSVDGATGAVPASEHPAPALLNFDGDLNVDLEVRFDRAALIGLLGQTSGPAAIVRASWQYTDGGDGTASAQIRVRR